MKIAYLINQYPKTSHSFIRREIFGLEATGIEVVRFSLRSCQEELVDEVDRKELAKTRIVLDVGIFGLLLNVIRVAAANPLRFGKVFKTTISIGWKSDRGVFRHFAYLAEACVLLKWFKELEIERVHAHFGTNSTAVAMLCFLLDGPSYSFTVHGPEEFDKATLIALPEKIRHATFVVAVSSFVRSQLYRWCEYEQWKKVYVVHCGVDRSFLQASPQQLPKSAQLVCVGRLCEQKGQLLLVEVAHQLVERGIEFKLVFVGDGDLRKPIEALIERYKLHNTIEITGWANSAEVREQLLAARALVLPSFAEGLPVVIMESLALGRPVISTYIAGIPELVEPGVSGWLVPSGSVDALVSVIDEVLQTSGETLEQMGKVGAKQVAEQHNADVEARKLSKLLHASG